jgi:ATP-binding cassette subfamily F protein 3
VEYTGTVVFVSHDRYFIDRLATRVFEVGDGKVEVFPGNYEDYLWRKQGGSARLAETIAASTKRGESPIAASSNSAANAQLTDGDATAAPKIKRLNPIKRKQMQDRVRELEEEISLIEGTVAQCETGLQNFVSADQSQRQSQTLDRHKAALASLTREWEDLSQALQESD